MSAIGQKATASLTKILSDYFTEHKYIENAAEQ
jgi:hypothetical protein